MRVASPRCGRLVRPLLEAGLLEMTIPHKVWIVLE